MDLEIFGLNMLYDPVACRYGNARSAYDTAVRWPTSCRYFSSLRMISHRAGFSASAELVEWLCIIPVSKWAAEMLTVRFNNVTVGCTAKLVPVLSTVNVHDYCCVQRFTIWWDTELIHILCWLLHHRCPGSVRNSSLNGWLKYVQQI